MVSIFVDLYQQLRGIYRSFLNYVTKRRRAGQMIGARRRDELRADDRVSPKVVPSVVFPTACPQFRRAHKLGHACSTRSGVLGAGGESRGTASAEGRCRTAVTVSVPGGSVVR